MIESNLLTLAREFARLRKEVKGVLEMPVGPQGERGEKGDRGDNGEPGRDGLNGLPGKDGRDGRNGLDGLNGKPGKDGKGGKDGKDGVSVVDAEIDFDGHFRITLSDGKILDVGEISPEKLHNVFVSGGSVTNTGSQSTSGTATLNFGAFPGTNEASVDVTGQTDILSTSNVRAYIGADDTSGTHTASDHKYFSVFTELITGVPTDGVGFTIYARSSEKMMGTFAVRWVWSN